MKLDKYSYSNIFLGAVKEIQKVQSVSMSPTPSVEIEHSFSEGLDPRTKKKITSLLKRIWFSCCSFESAFFPPCEYILFE